MNNYQQRKGILLAITGAALWGLSGVASQYLFKQVGIAPAWLVGMRLLIGGFLALGLSWVNRQSRSDVWAIWQTAAGRKQLILFSLFGFLPSQLSYFMAINYGNVATAASLQFLSPAFTVIYFMVIKRSLPQRVEIITVLISILGTFLLITNGNLAMLVITPLGIMWGLLAGVGQVAYSILPKKLLDQYQASVVVGWGMFLGGLPLLPTVISTPLPSFTMWGYLAVAFVVLAGTLVACLCYISSLKYILSAVAQMLDSFEPLTAAVFSILVLHQTLELVEIVGMLLIVSVVFIQSLAKRSIND